MSVLNLACFQDLGLVAYPIHFCLQSKKDLSRCRRTVYPANSINTLAIRGENPILHTERFSIALIRGLADGHCGHG